MKRLWQKITGPSAEEIAAVSAAAAAAAAAASAAASSSATGDGANACICVAAAEPIELDLEDQLALFESTCADEDGASYTLLQALERMLAAELVASAAAAAVVSSSAESADAGETLPSTLLPAPSPPPRSAVLRLFLSRARRSVMSRVSLGALNLLGELVATYRDQLAEPPTPPAIAAAAASAISSALIPSAGAAASSAASEPLALQSVLLDLFRLLAPYTSNTAPLHGLFNLFESPRWSASIVHMLRLLATSSCDALAYVLFDPPSSTLSSLLHVPSIANVKWNSAHQYTTMTWMRMDFKQRRRRTPRKEEQSLPSAVVHQRNPSAQPALAFPPPQSELACFAHPSFHLFMLSCDNDDTKTSVDLSFSPSANAFTLRTGGQKSVVFALHSPLSLGRWHHVALTHSKALLGASTATLYVDGQIVATLKAHFPSKPSSSANVSVRVGMLPLAKERMIKDTPLPLSTLPPPPPSVALQWRVSSLAFLDESASESCVRVLYDLGPRMAGVAAGAALHAAKCAVTDAGSSGYIATNALNEALDEVALVVARADHPPPHRSSVAENRTALSATPSPASSSSSSTTPQPSSLDNDDDDSNEPPLPGSASLRFSVQEGASLLPTSFLSPEALVFFFSARNSVDREQHDMHLHHHEAAHHRRASSSAAAGSASASSAAAAAAVSGCPPPPPPAPASILINGGLLGAKEGASDALVGSAGRAHLVKPRAFADALRSIGGVSRLLSLLAKICLQGNKVDAQATALREAMLLLAECLRRNPKNLREMTAQRGYTLLAHLLQRLGETAASLVTSTTAASTTKTPHTPPRPSPCSSTSSRGRSSLTPLDSVSSSSASAASSVILSDTGLVEVAFSLAGLSEKGVGGSIAAMSAMSSLILNYQIWSHFSVEVQTYLFEGLVNCIATNPSREDNMAALRSLKLVPWLLTLVADQKLPPTILVHAVSLLREFLMDPSPPSQSSSSSSAHPPHGEELQLVSNFALTACMLHSQHEIHLQQQQTNAAAAATAAATTATPAQSPMDTTGSSFVAAPTRGSSTGPQQNPSVRRFTGAQNSEASRAPSGGSSSSGSGGGGGSGASATIVNVGGGLSALGVATGYLGGHSAEDPHAFEGELASFRLGSFLSPRVRRTFLELLLDVLSKLHARASSSSASPGDMKALDHFVKQVDFTMLFAVLYTADQAVAHRTKRLQREQADEATAAATATPGQKRPSMDFGDPTSASSQDEEVACDVACALLSLKILLTYLSHAHLAKRFMAVHGFGSLAQLLLPYAHLPDVYAIVLCMAMGRGVYDIPQIGPATSTIRAPHANAQHEEWWSHLLPAPSTTSTPVIVPLPEAIPVLMALLEEALTLLAEDHKTRVTLATTTATTAVEITLPSSSFASVNSSSSGLAGEASSAVTAGSLPPNVNRRSSFIAAAGLGAGVLNSVAASAQSAAPHQRHGSVSLAAMAIAAGNGGASLSRGASDDEHESHRRSSTSHSRRASAVAPVQAASTTLDRSFWQPAPTRRASTSSSSTAADGRRRSRLGVRAEALSSSSQPSAVSLLDEVVLQHVLGFLSHLLTVSEDFRSLASKEPFVRALAACAYASAPLQPSAPIESGPVALPASCLIDANSFIAFPPTALQGDVIPSPANLIISPIFALFQTMAPGQGHVRQQSNSITSSSASSAATTAGGSMLSLARRRLSHAQTRPQTPADLASSSSNDPTLSRSANSSRPTTPLLTPMATVTLSEHEWSTLQRVGHAAAAMEAADEDHAGAPPPPQPSSFLMPPTGLTMTGVGGSNSPSGRATPSAGELTGSGRVTPSVDPSSGRGTPLPQPSPAPSPSASTSSSWSNVSPPNPNGSKGQPEVFHHALSTSLFHMLRTIAHHALTTSPRGAAIVEEMLDQAPAGHGPLLTPSQAQAQDDSTSSSASASATSVNLANLGALRGRFQAILHCSLLYRLSHAAPSDLLSTPKFGLNMVAHAKHLQSRLVGGTLHASAQWWLHLVLALLESPEGRSLLELECGEHAAPPPSYTMRRRSSTAASGTATLGSNMFNLASCPLARPLMDSSNATLLLLYQHHATVLAGVLATPAAGTSASLALGNAASVGGGGASGGLANIALSSSLGAAGVAGAGGGTSLLPVALNVNTAQLHSLHELSRLNQLLLAHHATLLGQYQHDLVFLACISFQVLQLVAPCVSASSNGGNDFALSLSAQATQVAHVLSMSSMRVWGCLLRAKLGYMSELLRLAAHQTVNAVTGVIGVDTVAAALAAGGASPMPASLHEPGPLSPPRSPNTLVDLLDGGFDQLLGIGLGSGNGTDESTESEFAEFLAWRSASGPQIALVLNKTAGKILSHHCSEMFRSSTTSIAHQAASLLAELAKHSGAAIAVDNRLPQLEFALLAKLQRTCSDELQRNLRKQQRERIDQGKQDRTFFLSQEKAWMRTHMVYSTLDYAKRGLTEDETALVVSQPSATSTGMTTAPAFVEYPLSSSLVLRQPWRLDRVEGPSRMRKRLEELRVQPMDQPLFTFPYRPFENERHVALQQQQQQQAQLVAQESQQQVTTTASRLPESVTEDNEDSMTEASPDQSSTEAPRLEPMMVQCESPPIESVSPARPLSVDVHAAHLDHDAAEDSAPPLLNRSRSLAPSTTTAAAAAAATAAAANMSMLATPARASHRSTRSDVSALFTTAPLRSATSTRARGGLGGLVSASPHQSMLGRLASGLGSGDHHHHAGGSPAKRPSRHPGQIIAGASFTPRTRLTPAARLFSPASPSPLSPGGSEGGAGLRRLLMARGHLTSPEGPVAHSPTNQGTNTFTAGMVCLSPMSPSPRALGSSNTTSPTTFTWADDSTANDGPSSIGITDMQLLSPLAVAVAEGEEGGEEEPPSATEVATEGEPSEDELDVQHWWVEEERLSLLLADEVIRFHFNCLRVDGLDEVRGILLLCDRAMFVVDNYEVSPLGDITPVLSDAEMDRLADEAEHGGGAQPEDALLAAPIEHHSEKLLYSDLVDLQKRRYLLREAAIELFLQSGTSSLLVVNVAQRDAIYASILSASALVKTQQNALSKILAAGASAVSSVGAATTSGPRNTSASASFLHSSVPTTRHHSNEFAETLRTQLHPLTKLWQNGSLSNFAYLMACNNCSSRTMNDLTQYPVMPWILSDYSSEELDLDRHASFRDLSKPMAALDETRAQVFRQRYRDSDSIMIEVEGGEPRPCPKFHTGSHYSSSAAVLYYMLRMEPFTEASIIFQSGRFDRPDRLFHSIKQTYLSAAKLSTSDVKELIPEFFFLPEFLANGNRLNLGTRQAQEGAQGQVISDVLLPRWAHGSAREFIRLHRRALESEDVSAHLHEWIDLIFGFKQQGEAAVHALNVFYYLTYAGGVDLDAITDPIMRRSVLEQTRSFGQTPLSLFSKPHPPKHLMREAGCVYLKPHLLRPSTSLHFAHAIGALWVDAPQERFFLLRPGHVLAPAEGGAAVVGVASSAVREKRKRGPKASFVAFGFMDGTLRLGDATSVPLLASAASSTLAVSHASSVVRHTRVLLNMHDGAVRAAAFPEVDVGLLVTGGSDSNVQVWRREPSTTSSTPGGDDYSLLATLHGHRAPITCLAVSKSFSLIASGSLDATLLLWDLFAHTPLRQVRVLPPSSKIVSVVINNQVGLIVLAANNPPALTVVDLNGALVAQYPNPNASTAGASTVDGENEAESPVVESLETISCLHMVDSVGHQMPRSALLFLTGHASGAIRVWNLSYLTPQQLSASSSSGAPAALHSGPPTTPGGASRPAKIHTTPSGTPRSVQGTPRSGGPQGTPRSGSSTPGTAHTKRTLPSYLTTMVEVDESGDADAALVATGPSSPSAATAAATAEQEAVDEGETDEPAWDVEDEADAAEQLRAAQLDTGSAGAMPMMRKVRSLPVGSSTRAILAGASSPTLHAPSLTPAAKSLRAATLPSAASLGALDVDAITAAGVSPSPVSVAVPVDSNDTGGRSWFLHPVAELVGHVAPVSALFVPADRTSVWSGDAQGHVTNWTLPVEMPSTSTTPSASPASSSSSHPAVPQPCTCKQSAAHRAATVSSHATPCSQCRQPVCAYCRLDHLRREHSAPSAPHLPPRNHTPTGSISISAANTPRGATTPNLSIAASL